MATLHLVYRIGIVVIAAAVGVTTAGFAAESSPGCSAFGDAPAEVQRGVISSFVSTHNPHCFKGKTIGPWKDANGDDRYACLYEPGSASATQPLPLVVFLHGSMATADSILVTGLVSRTGDANLGGAKPGFILLAPEGRHTSHYYPAPDDKALGWDNWYRQFSASGDATIEGTAYPENADAAAIDHFVNQVVASGKVDTRRIYVMGWSNGAAMAILYALNRPSIAAAAVYSAPNPFDAYNDPCPQTPVAGRPVGIGELQVSNPQAPLMHVRNACDIGGICPNGDKLAGQLRAMKNDVNDVVLNSDGTEVTKCDPSCGTNPNGGEPYSTAGGTAGFFHHLRWPKEWNDRMFAFLAVHTSNAPIPASIPIR